MTEFDKGNFQHILQCAIDEQGFSQLAAALQLPTRVLGIFAFGELRLSDKFFTMDFFVRFCGVCDVNPDDFFRDDSIPF